MVADHLAVQGEGGGQLAGVGLQPPDQEDGEGVGVEMGEHVVEDRVAGHLPEGLAAFLARQAEQLALGLGEALGEAGELRELAAAA